MPLILKVSQKENAVWQPISELFKSNCHVEAGSHTIKKKKKKKKKKPIPTDPPSRIQASSLKSIQAAKRMKGDFMVRGVFF